MNELAARADDVASLRLLLEQVHAVSGYDFRDYALEAVLGRVQARLVAEQVETIEALRERVVGDPGALMRLIDALAARPETLFRAPDFLRAFRKHVVPALRTYPSIRLWHAGCGRGGETLAMAVILREEGLLSRCRFYATDVSATAIHQAKEGLFALDLVRSAERGYSAAGGAARLADHVSLQGGGYRFHPELRERITFFEHSLATDASFNEFHVIVSRFALSQFSRTLLKRVYRLFEQSLCPLGFLGCARPEALAESAFAMKLEVVDRDNCLYQKVR